MSTLDLFILWVGLGGWIALFIALAGNRDLAAENRGLLSDLTKARREIRRPQTACPEVVRSIAESPSFAPVAEILARNEAARANWDDIQTWGDAS